MRQRVSAFKRFCIITVTALVILANPGTAVALSLPNPFAKPEAKPLPADTKPASAPAADAVKPSGKVAKVSDDVAKQLKLDRQLSKDGKPRDNKHVKTLDENRNENNRVFLNADGSKSFEHSEQATSYQEGGQWKDVDMTLDEDKGAGVWKSRANSWQAKFGSSNAAGVQVTAGQQSAVMKPVGGADIKPVVTGSAPHQIVTYRNVWPGIDLQYTLSGSEVKETIVVKSRAARTSYDFDLTGTGLSPDPDHPGALKLDGSLSSFSLTTPTVATFDQGVLGSDQVKQTVNGSRLTLKLDDKWLKDQPIKAFPVTIYPTIVRWSNQGPWYRNFKSDGFICDPGMGCGNSVGNASNYFWRFAYHVEFPEISGKYVASARLNLEMPNPDGVHYYGTYDPRWIWVDHASCLNSIECADLGEGEGSGIVGSNNDVDVTQLYRNTVNFGDFGNWMMVRSEEVVNWPSYKLFAYDMTRVTFDYDAYPNPSYLADGAPADNGVAVTTPPTLKSTAASDPDGTGPIRYRYTVGTSKTGAGGGHASSLGGIVADSGDNDTPSWAVPDNVLQDGTTYYWQVQTWDSWPGVPATFSPVYSFKVDLRQGKDSIQAYDSAGPVSVDLATGNLTTSAKTHSIAALGGSLGVTNKFVG